MISRVALSIVFVASLTFVIFVEAKTPDLYKVLGVERTAGQREIQKAFHKLSLQHHPDKNKNKGAKEKFEEINNAYEILSDDEKRKNYDMYGDARGSPGFNPGNPGDQERHTYFTSGGPGQTQFTFRPGEWQDIGRQWGSKSFTFSFGSPNSHGPFSFGMKDIFSSFFGDETGSWGQFGGFSGSTRTHSQSKGSSESLQAVNSLLYNKEIVDRGITWLLLSKSSHASEGSQYHESVMEEISNMLRGSLKVGSINCDTELSFCKGLGIYPLGAPRVFVYSYRRSESGSLVEYGGDLDVRSLKIFCQDHLPTFSKRVDLSQFEFPTGSRDKLPSVMLLSTKKDTPSIWRTLSGLYHKHFIFYDAGTHDVSDPKLEKLGADALPAIIGWLSNGEKHVLKTGISVKDMESAIQEISTLLNGFEKKNKKASFNQAKGPQGSESVDNHIPLLTRSNIDALCGEKTPVCIIGAFRSPTAREKLESILSLVSQKPLSRRLNLVSGSRDSVQYAILDGSKQPAFLNAFGKSGFKSYDNLLVAYKPRKQKFAAFAGEITREEVEGFVSSVLNGDVQFSRARQKPTLK